MLLKKQEKDNIVRAIYTSSTVCASIFDKNTQDLIIIFNNGGQYKYPNVAPTDYTRLEISESTGSDFNIYIKKKYLNFEKLPKLDDSTLTSIINEVEQLKKSDNSVSLEVRTKTMLGNMSKILYDYILTGKIEKLSIEKLESSISDYNKITQN